MVDRSGYTNNMERFYTITAIAYNIQTLAVGSASMLSLCSLAVVGYTKLGLTHILLPVETCS